MQGVGHGANLNPSYTSTHSYDLRRYGATGGSQTLSKHGSPPKHSFGTSRREDFVAMHTIFTVKPR